MKSEWSIKPLSECIELIIDYRGKTPKKLGGDWSKTGYRALSAKNVKTSGLVQEDIIRRVDDNLYKKWMKEEVKRGDILLTSEAPLGEVLLWDSDEKIVLSQRLFAIRPNKNLDSAYMYYYMSAKKYQHELESRATGTTVVGIKQTQLVHTLIEYPKLDTQKKIARILSTLDDKIELNRKMNQTLEAMTQALFKSWFVDFDPVHVRTKCKSEEELEAGAKELGIAKEVLELFPSKFVESEMGMIPLGWEVSTVGEEFTVVMGQSPSGKSYNEMKNGMLFFQGRRDFGSYYPSERVYTTEPKRIAQEDDILLSVRAPVGDINIAIKKCCIGRGLSSLKHKSNSVSYSFLAMKYLRKYFDSYNLEGTVFGSVNQKTLKAMSIIKSDGIMQKFNELSEPLFSKIKNNTKQIYALQTTRDTLLPKLLSGELDVTEVEI